MSADRKQLIELFDAKVHSFASPEGVRFHALLSFKEGIKLAAKPTLASSALASMLSSEINLSRTGSSRRRIL
jgi:hypothetical protein